jgi:hypothetical protein
MHKEPLKIYLESAKWFYWKLQEVIKTLMNMKSLHTENDIFTELPNLAFPCIHNRNIFKEGQNFSIITEHITQ